MRLGAPVFEKPTGPDHWAALVKAEGYSAAYCPVGVDADDKTVRDYADAAKRENIVIAEVGAFGVNPIHHDPAERRKAIAFCADQLALAEGIGARCCVNVAGTRNPDRWAAPHPANFTRDTFDMIVESTRAIIDAVKPTRTYYTLEMMPYVWPESADQNLELLAAIDRPAMAVHLDVVNILNTPLRAFDTAAVLRDCFDKLGGHIRCCHGKDIAIADQLTVHLNEVAPGQGLLDYPLFLRELSRLDPDTPLMLEHMKTAEAYRAAAEYVRKVAREQNLTWQ